MKPGYILCFAVGALITSIPFVFLGEEFLKAAALWGRAPLFATLSITAVLVGGVVAVAICYGSADHFSTRGR